jgi:hypothetical protein
MPPTPAITVHDDYHLEPIFYRFDIDNIIRKLLSGMSRYLRRMNVF